jgi:hypothetical protein
VRRRTCSIAAGSAAVSFLEAKGRILVMAVLNFERLAPSFANGALLLRSIKRR